ncbi:MAG: cytochrome d ubiquinol oxidase subunit II [Paramuribaculum sp.]|nr:cytochrome d ubiquinol oxidase subunit II [Paramuribaculum sp.]
MDSLECLQIYWWLLIAVLGAALVFMLFVQGGQSMLLCKRNAPYRPLMIEILGHKWELTFTTLVVFGGAFFASFPLFYSTSFGGAYWLWMLILFSFILQAVSYEFRSKPGNLLGERTYDVFLFINGSVGCVLLGVAVGMMFFGGEFTVAKGNILDGSAPVISQWSSTHGLEAIFCWKNLIFGFAVLFLARTMALLYFVNCAHGKDEKKFASSQRGAVLVNGAIFVVLFLAFLFVLLTSQGVEAVDGSYCQVEYKYLDNFLSMWWVTMVFLLGVIAVLWGILSTVLSDKSRNGIWWAGIGAAAVVVSLFCVAGYNGTAYYPSLIDVNSSLTIHNSSSSLFTLRVMTWVSIVTPFVLGYIAYVWKKMR